MYGKLWRSVLAVGLLSAALAAVSPQQASGGRYYYGGYGYGYPVYTSLYYTPYSYGWYRPVYHHRALHRTYYAPVYRAYSPCCYSYYYPCYDTCWSGCSYASRVVYGSYVAPCCGGVATAGYSSGTVISERVVGSSGIVPSDDRMEPTPADPSTQPAAPEPAAERPRLETPPEPPEPPAAAGERGDGRGEAPPFRLDDAHFRKSSPRADSGMIVLNVPVDARVTINGRPTSSTGSRREYVSHGLKAGYKYSYDVAVEIVRDGRTIRDEKQIDLIGGQTESLAFDFRPEINVASRPVETKVTVVVPEDAQVYLGGHVTKATGRVREFATHSLPAGQTWKDYQVRVTWEQDGKTVTRDEALNLTAGDVRTLRFVAGADQVAAAD